MPNVPSTANLVACLLALALAVRAQTPVKSDEGPPQRSMLEAKEQIYQSKLKQLQAPLLTDYLAELNALLLKTTRPAEETAVKAEIERVNKMISTGVVEMYAAKPAPTPGSKTPPVSGIVFSLDPNEATPAPPAGKFVPIGSASWQLSLLTAGNYDLVAYCACPKLPVTPTIKIDYHGTTLTREFKVNNVTKDEDTFRLVRLGQLKLSEDVKMEKVVVTSSDSGEPWLFIKQILITRSRPAK